MSGNWVEWVKGIFSWLYGFDIYCKEAFDLDVSAKRAPVTKNFDALPPKSRCGVRNRNY